MPNQLLPVNYRAFVTALRKIATILVLLMLLFNWFGYRLLFNYLQDKKDSQLEARFDNNNYDQSQLIEIKIPLNLPYQNNWSAFERYDGEIKYNGVIYKYVKRKVENNNLILLCYPNNDKMHLQNAKDEFFKLANDVQQQNHGKKPSPENTKAFKSLLSEYLNDKNEWRLNAIGDTKRLYIECNLSLTSEGYLLSPEQPPEV